MPGTETPIIRRLAHYRLGFLWVLVGWCVLLAPTSFVGIPFGRTVADVFFVVGAWWLAKADRRGQRLVVLAGTSFAVAAAFEGFSLWNRFSDPSLQEPGLEEASTIVVVSLGVGIFLLFLWNLLSFIQGFLVERKRIAEASTVEDRRYWIVGVYAVISVLALMQTLVPSEMFGSWLFVALLVGLVAMVGALAAWVMVLISLVTARGVCATDLTMLAAKRGVSSPKVERAAEMA